MSQAQNDPYIDKDDTVIVDPEPLYEAVFTIKRIKNWFYVDY